jgi:hypothetical protein
MQTLAALLKSKPPLIWPQPSSARAVDIKSQIEALQVAPIEVLREEWSRRYGKPVPVPRSKDLLLRFLAWRIQADAFGGHSPEVLKILSEPVERKSKRKAQPESLSLRKGTLLKRDWAGKQHIVTVTTDGFVHEGQAYKSLSEVARKITGTRWSGPRFFGTEKAAARRGAGE